MKIELKIPAVGESITEVTIGKILKPNGTIVKRDEELIEIETDKLNQVLYAPGDGLVTFFVKTGDVVKVGDVIAAVESQELKAIDIEKKPEASKKAESITPPKPTVPAPQNETAPTVQARKQKNEWLSELGEGSKEEQVEVSKKPAEARSETRKKLSRIRQVIAARLLEVTQETAMLTTFNEVDMSQVIAMREKYKEEFQKKHGVKLGFMSFFVKAATAALEAFPMVNSFIEGDELVTRNYIDIGIAVSSERGLIVPVLRDTNHLSYAEIEEKIDDAAARAKTGRLTVDELTGGSFTITNGGVLGSLLSTPIINPPQCAILGMHKIMKRAVVVDDQIVIRPMMYLALSYDHRVLDGKDAISFLVHIKNHLEEPQKEILGL